MSDTRRRVKLYALNAERQWDDKGTGHVSSTYVERLKGISLLVRAESDGSLLLESKIQTDTAYQKQQETLIVWSEGDNFDLALSFQEKAGCDEIWEKICTVQGKDPSVEFTQDIVEESEDERCFDEMMSGSDTIQPIDLPNCEIAKLEEISELVNSCLPSPIRREKLAVAIENEGYIKKLINVFHMSEDLENAEGLHHLYEIFKNIFLLNKNALFELMFAEDTIFDVVGCLEYDPALQTPKRHRQYLKSIANFHQVIPITNPELLSKIHQTYRVQYIQDVVLPTPSVFEENMFSTLSSFIFFNKVEIVSLIQEDDRFLTELFTQLTSDKTDEKTRKESVLFLKEFCTFSQTLQQQARESFFKSLNNLGILSALEITLASENRATKSASIDILLFIVDFSPSMVREYMLQQLNTTEEDCVMLMNVIIEQMTCDSDPEMGGAVQLMGIIRTLVDPDNMVANVNKSEKSDFLNYFYKHCMHVFIAPLISTTSGNKAESMDCCTVQLLSLILELLSFCVEHHTYHIKNYILQRGLLRRILVLMKSRHTFLVLCALRFMRKIIALKDEFYNRYIINGNLFAPVIDAFISNNGRYNLLDSAILEMFEFIKLEDIKSLCSHVVENYGQTLDKISYVKTFKNLKMRYDQHQDRIKDRSQGQLDSVSSILRPGRFRRDPRDMDEDEEMWFDDDEFEENGMPPASSGLTRTNSVAVGTTAATFHQQQQQLAQLQQQAQAQQQQQPSGSGLSPSATNAQDGEEDSSSASTNNSEASTSYNCSSASAAGGQQDEERTTPSADSAATESSTSPVVSTSSSAVVEAAASAAAEPAAEQSAIKKGGLVDYGEDSDDDEAAASTSNTPNNSRTEEAADGEEDEESSSREVGESSTSNEVEQNETSTSEDKKEETESSSSDVTDSEDKKVSADSVEESSNKTLDDSSAADSSSTSTAEKAEEEESANAASSSSSSSTTDNQTENGENQPQESSVNNGACSSTEGQEQQTEKSEVEDSTSSEATASTNTNSEENTEASTSEEKTQEGEQQPEQQERQQQEEEVGSSSAKRPHEEDSSSEVNAAEESNSASAAANAEASTNEDESSAKKPRTDE